MESYPRSVWAHHGVIATPNALASGTGLRILARGGNAVEAAIGAAATMAVVYPHMNGIGGDNVWLIHDGRHGETRALLGIGCAGQQVSIKRVRDHGVMGRLPDRGALAVNTPPGAVDGWWEAYQYSVKQLEGRLDWDSLLADAIRYADDGYPVSESQAMWSTVLLGLVQKQSFSGLVEAYLTPSGQTPEVGRRQLMPHLAETLRVIARKGRDGFYRGPVAESIVDELQQGGGLLEYGDWGQIHAVWDHPISVSYRDRYQLLNTPAPTQGFTALMMMGLMENWSLDKWGPDSVRYLHVMIESAKLALKVRNQELGDPGWMTNAPADLLAVHRLQTLARQIDPDGPAIPLETGRGLEGGTVAIMAVDQMGNAVSLIQSLYSDFGSGFFAKRAGVLMHNRGTSFSLLPNGPNSLAPGKRPAHTLSAAMALSQGSPVLVYGTMGGDGQPQIQAEVVTRILDFGMSVNHAVDAPRWLYDRTWGPRQEAAVVVESRFSPAVIEQLRQRGHNVHLLSEYDDKMGHAHVVRINAATKAMTAAADPRSDGGAYVI